MELNKLKNAPGARKDAKRVGRGPGSGKGKTSSRGHKGARARSGYSRHYGFEGGQIPLHRRLPKRGFKRSDRYPMAEINVDVLERVFEDGAEVTAEALIKAGLAASRKGGLKLLGRGEVSKKFTVKVQAVTPGARAKIEAAGGTVELIGAAAGAPAAETK